MNYTGLITPQTKFQSPQIKDKRQHPFSVSSYSIATNKTLLPIILSTPLATVFISELVLKRGLQKMYTFTLLFVVSEPQLIKTVNLLWSSEILQFSCTPPPLNMNYALSVSSWYPSQLVYYFLGFANFLFSCWPGSLKEYKKSFNTLSNFLAQQESLKLAVTL